MILLWSSCSLLSTKSQRLNTSVKGIWVYDFLVEAQMAARRAGTRHREEVQVLVMSRWLVCITKEEGWKILSFLLVGVPSVLWRRKKCTGISTFWIWLEKLKLSTRSSIRRKSMHHIWTSHQIEATISERTRARSGARLTRKADHQVEKYAWLRSSFSPAPSSFIVMTLGRNKCLSLLRHRGYRNWPVFLLPMIKVPLSLRAHLFPAIVWSSSILSRNRHKKIKCHMPL